MPDRKRCCEEVREEGRWPRWHPCTRPVTITVEGKDYCTIHSPEKVAERRAKAHAAWKDANHLRSIEFAAHEMFRALKDIRLHVLGTEEHKRGWDDALTIIERLEGPQ
jgi:hypothetical protein